MADSIRDQVAVVGVGNSRQGQLPDLDNLGIAVEAFQAALDDAGLKKQDVDGIAVRPLDPGGVQWQGVARTLGLNPRFGFGGNYGGASLTIAMQQAAMAIHHGLASTVAVLYATNSRTARRSFGGARYDWHAPAGYFSPGARLAMAFHRYMYDFCGVTSPAEEAVRPQQRKLGAIYVAMRRHASLNPIAYHSKPIDAEDYLADRYICWPLRRGDYTLITDGGGCLILTSAERARDFPKPPVYLSGMGQGHQLRAQESPEYIYQRLMDGSAAASVYASAGVGPGDIDAMYVYDSFSVLTLFALENFGICKTGEGLDFVQDGRIELDGDFPVNTNGGHLAESYIGGVLQYVEAVRQLRGECGERQIKKDIAQVLCCGEGGGATNSAAVVLRKG